MRNYQLIEAIYKICQDADYRGMFGVRGNRNIDIAKIANLIEEQRPELKEACSSSEKAP